MRRALILTANLYVSFVKHIKINLLKERGSFPKAIVSQIIKNVPISNMGVVSGTTVSKQINELKEISREGTNMKRERVHGCETCRSYDVP